VHTGKQAEPLFRVWRVHTLARQAAIFHHLWLSSQPLSLVVDIREITHSQTLLREYDITIVGEKCADKK